MTTRVFAILAVLLAQVAPPPAPPSPPSGRPPAAPTAPPAAPPAAAAPGVPASAAVVQQLQTALAAATRRLEAKDLAGVLTHVSDEYRTGPMTKAAVRGQLLTIFQVYEVVRARVRIDDVRMVGERAWVFSTGEVTGRLPIVGQWMTIFWWERELEIARNEGGTWRLHGYQQ
jgi:hypothetical protein